MQIRGIRVIRGVSAQHLIDPAVRAQEMRYSSASVTDRATGSTTTAVP